MTGSRAPDRSAEAPGPFGARPNSRFHGLRCGPDAPFLFRWAPRPGPLGTGLSPETFWPGAPSSALFGRRAGVDAAILEQLEGIGHELRRAAPPLHRPWPVCSSRARPRRGGPRMRRPIARSPPPASRAPGRPPRRPSKPVHDRGGRPHARQPLSPHSHGLRPRIRPQPR